VNEAPSAEIEHRIGARIEAPQAARGWGVGMGVPLLTGGGVWRGGCSEAPQAARGWGVGMGVPLLTGGGVWRGAVPHPQKNFCILGQKIVSFGAF